MSLLDFLEDEPEDPMVNAVQTLSEKIRQRRHQMIIHSYIYYHLDDNIVSDDKWQQWANELALLQNENPDDCQLDFYDEEFIDWDGTSGAFLPLKDINVRNKAAHILRISENSDVQTDKNVVQYTGTLEEFIS